MSLRESNTVYSILAKFYDLFDLIFLFGGQGNPRSGLMDVFRNAPSSILDVCVGTAASSIQVAEYYEQCQILGIDISDAMLSVAQKKISRKKLTNIELVNMSADAMRFDDNSFDAVMVSFALHELEDELRERILQEITRVLKPGGKFCLIDFARQKNLSNQMFMKVWTLLEPSCFSSFLNIDWHWQLEGYGMHYEHEREYSFSKLYIIRKT